MQTRYKQFLWAIPIAVLSTCGGAVGAYAVFKSSLEAQVAEAYEKESLEQRTLNVKITEGQTLFDVPHYFSEREEFKPTEIKGKSADKVGFSYRADNTTKSKYHGVMCGKDVDFRYGEEYEFSLKELFNQVNQVLSISYYNGQSLLPSSNASMYDDNSDNIPDTIYLTDQRKGAGPVITVRRNEKGKLEYRYVSEDGAKGIFDMYTEIFQQFKKEENIDARINAYIPSMVIGN